MYIRFVKKVLNIFKMNILKKTSSLGKLIIQNNGTKSLIMKRFLASLKVGQRLPDVEVYENNPGNKFKITDLFAGKKGILLGMPGAFTPTCSRSHLPGFIQNIDQVRAKGYEVVACVVVNDAFVTDAWGKSEKAEGVVRMLADPTAAFTKAIQMDKDLQALGGVRSKRYTAVIEDNVVKQVFEEPDGTGGTCSLASNVLKQI